jgi:6-phosphogluconolactonase
MNDGARTVYVGAGSWSGDTGKIQVFSLDVETAGLELGQELEAGGAAAFMARSSDGRMLYVADETKGLLSSYAIDADTGHLSRINTLPCAGHPVYVALDGSGRSLTTCFFEEGKTEVFAIEADGALGASSCIVASGKESHCTVFDPTYRFLFVPTRGDNWIAQYRFDAVTRQLTPNDRARVPEAPFAGPRHLAFHPNGRFAYLVNELDLTLSSYACDPTSGTLARLQGNVPAAPAGSTGGASADIHVHPGGKFLYLSNRQGDESNLAIFAVDATSGEVSLVGHELTRGRTPRNFALDPEGRLLIVGNQDSAEIAVFRVAAGGGKLSYLRSQPVAPGPFFVGIY